MPLPAIIQFLLEVIIRHDWLSALSLVVEVLVKADAKERTADVMYIRISVLNERAVCVV